MLPTPDTLENHHLEAQPSERVRRVLYRAILSASASPELDDDDRLWIVDHALDLVGDFAAIKDHR